MNIQFNYEVLSVDKTNNVMEVMYSAEGYESIRVSVMVPFFDSDFEEHIKSYAPLHTWKNSKRTFSYDHEGKKGTIKPVGKVEDEPIYKSLLSNEDVLKIIADLKVP